MRFPRVAAVAAIASILAVFGPANAQGTVPPPIRKFAKLPLVTQIGTGASTSCTVIEVAASAGSGALLSITNAGAATTATITLYDEGDANCSNAPIYGPFTLGAGQVITWALPGLPLANGLAYKLSAAPGATITVVSL